MYANELGKWMEIRKGARPVGLTQIKTNEKDGRHYMDGLIYTERLIKI